VQPSFGTTRHIVHDIGKISEDFKIGQEEPVRTVKEQNSEVELTYRHQSLLLSLEQEAPSFILINSAGEFSLTLGQFQLLKRRLKHAKVVAI